MVLSRLLRQMEHDAKVPPKLKKAIADALNQTGELMAQHGRKRT
jgi:hypothetical protein